MEPPADHPDPFSRLGKGLVQINLRLTQVLEAVERSPAGSDADSRTLEALLDLVDATGAALERRTAEPGRRKGLLSWLRPEPASEADLWRGIAMAHAAVLERLQAMGIERMPGSGAYDPQLHCAVETRPATSPEQAGTLAATHRPGWIRSTGSAPEVLRPAQVSVHQEREERS